MMVKKPLDDGELPIPMVDLDHKLREACKCSDVTLITWIKRYEVGGLSLGVKVGNEWRIYPNRLIRFLRGEGLPIMR
jgi:hypothetical protein